MIKEQCTSELKGSTLYMRGTDVKEISDILAIKWLLIPKHIKDVGNVSLGVWLQAEVIYKRHKEELFKQKSLKIEGHSLGGGIALHIAIMLFLDDYRGFIKINCKGAVKCIDEDTAIWLFPKRQQTIWAVNHKDPVPFLGWWKEPNHWTPRTGEKRKHFLDWSIKAHTDY